MAVSEFNYKWIGIPIMQLSKKKRNQGDINVVHYMWKETPRTKSIKGSLV